MAAVERALAVYRNRDQMCTLRRRVMNADFSWTGPAEQYEALYYDALRLRRSKLSADMKLDA